MKQAGFNLIELCICMSIAIILSGGFYYHYQNNKHEVERKQAELYLQDIALTLHEHEDNQKGFDGLSLEQLGFSKEKDEYSYTVNTTSHHFTISARPNFKDSCGTLTLTDKGTRTSSNDLCG
jgi:Tfp pilus assembly protein PilE